MSNDYNIDAIPDSVFDIIIDNTLSMDDIFEVNFAKEDKLHDIEGSVFEVDMGSIVQAQEASSTILQHDCMWSGTCQDKSHPQKAKNNKFSVLSVCREFEKELDWTSDSEVEAEVTEDPVTIETILEKNMPMLFTSSFDQPQSTITQQPPKVISQAIPRNTQPTFNRITFYQPLAENQFVLPQTTTVQAASTQFQSFKPIPHQSYLKNDQQCLKIDNNRQIEPVSNVVKFMPKSQSCFTFQYEEPIVQQHTLPSKLKIEPVYIYSNSMKETTKPAVSKFPNSSAKTETLAKVPKKRMHVEKPPKKATNKTKMKKASSNQLSGEIDRETLKNLYKYGNGSDNDDPLNIYEKRNMHNNLERERRIGLRNLFMDLKKAIPTLDDRDRVPKVIILKEAISFCGKVKRDEKILNELKKQNERLMNYAKRLQFSAPSKYYASAGSSSTSSASSSNE